MSSTPTTHWLDLSEQIGQSCDAFLAETPVESNPAFERVSQRMYDALNAFRIDPLNPTKTRSLDLAINNYSNTLEMAMHKARTVFEQAQEMGLDLNTLPAPHRSIIQTLLGQPSD